MLNFRMQIFGLLLVYVTYGFSQTSDSFCREPTKLKDPAPVLNYPDKYAWELFTQVNKTAQSQHSFKDSAGHKITTNSVLWETWADDPLTFPENPNPRKPPEWPGKKYPKKKIRPHAKGQFHGRVYGKGVKAKDFILDTGGEEVHRNRATFDYIIENSLWYTEGIAEFFKKQKKVDAPINSIEVKGNWVPIKPADTSKYHWNYDEKGALFGLVAMHITSKAIPNWFWATFEWVGNSGRCDFIGCHDCFGVLPPHQPSNRDRPGKQYPPGTLTSELLALFKTANLNPVWKNYRLKGSQVDFTDSEGEPLLVGNSVTEGGFVQTASCMTCHSRAAVDKEGKNVFPIFGEKEGLPLQDKIPTVWQTSFGTYNGTPDPNWFYSYNGLKRTRVNLQTDFIWAIPFQAHSVKKSKGTSKN